MAKIIDTSTLLETTSLSYNEKEWVYNGLDCCVTLEVFHELERQIDPIATRTYEFGKALQAPILEMTMRGVLVDIGRRDEVLRLYTEQVERLQVQLNAIVSEGVGWSEPTVNTTWWRSPAKLKTLFYDIMGMPQVRKRNAKGAFVPTLNREALEKLSDYLLAEPVARHILTLRDLDKKRGFLRTSIDADSRIRTNFNIAGTNTGRLASSMSDFGTGGNLQNVDRELRSVFVADPGYKFANLDLEQGDARNVGAICWDLFVEKYGEDFAGSYLSACESGDLHTTVCRMSRPDLPWTGDPKKDREIAEQIAYRQDSYRQLAKKLGHGCLTGDHEVLTPTGWVPISSMPDTIMQWSPNESTFTNPTHWEAKPYTGVMQYFEGASISACMTHDHRVPFFKDGTSQLVHEQPASAGPGKFMPLGDGWIGGTEQVPAKLIAAFMADGHQEKNWMSFHFHKQRKQQRLLDLCNIYGYEYRIHGDKIRVRGSLPKYPGAFMFNWTADCLRQFIDELKHWDGTVGKTSVSISSTRRQDLEWLQTFGRILGVGGNISKPYLSGFGSTVYRLQQNNRKFASGNSVKHYQHNVQNLMVYCPSVKTGWFYVRHKGHIFVTGNTNYYGTPRTMAKHTKVETAIIEDFQHRYFDAFPVIGSADRDDRTSDNWHNHVRSALQSTHTLITPFGRRRMFFGRSFEDSTIREAIAYAPQSMTADEIDTGLLNVWRQFPAVQLLIQVHDSILLQYPEELEDEILPKLIQAMRVPLQLAKGREFVVPVDAKIGWNWGEVIYWSAADAAKGKCKADEVGKPKDNPDGLIKWKGHDTRRRVNYPAGTRSFDELFR